jgi:outer membrane protein TolC
MVPRILRSNSRPSTRCSLNASARVVVAGLLVGGVFVQSALAQGRPTAAADRPMAATEPEPASAPRLSSLPRLLGLPDPLPVAVTIPAGAALDLGSAARAALAINPDVEGGDARAEAARQQHRAAQGNWLPRAELRLTSGRGRLESVDPDVHLDRYDHNLVLRQTVFDEVARHDVRRHRLLAEAAEAWALMIRGQALIETGQALVGLVSAQVSLKVAQDQERRLAALLGEITEAASPNAASDRDRVGARLANVRSQIADARASMQAAARNVERLTGVLPQALSVASLVDVAVPSDDQAALAALRLRNDELRARRLEADSVGAEVQSRQGRHWPRVELEVGHYRNRNVGGLPGQFQDTRGFAVLTWPLFSGGSDVANQRAAEARLVDAQSRLRAAERRLTQEVETAFSTLVSNAERLESVRAEVEGNRRLVASIQARPYGRDTSITDVLDAFARDAQSRNDLAQVLFARTQTRWRLAQLTGSLEAAVLGTGGSIR